MAHAQNPEDIIKKLSGYSSDSLKNDADTRREALALTKKLQQTLVDPMSEAVEFAFQPYKTIASRVAVDLDLYQLIDDANGEITTAELSKKSGGEERLIERILRLVSGYGLVNQTSKNTWSATPLTKAVNIPGIKGCHRSSYDLLIKSAIHAPAFLKETKYREPVDPNYGFVQYGLNTKLQAFEYMASQPELLRDFNNFMGFTMGGRGYWVDWFPVEQEILQGYDPSTPLLVDVGGGKGHDIQAFQSKYPNKGRLVLQDLSQAQEKDFPLDKSIEQQVHNFYEPQPVTGARVYFMHHILHDWPDKSCLAILSHLRKAMTPGYSKLLLHELILPDVAPSAFQTIWDMAMLTFTAGAERNEAWWTELMTEAGFEITKFWRGTDPESDGIIEAIPK